LRCSAGPACGPRWRRRIRARRGLQLTLGINQEIRRGGHEIACLKSFQNCKSIFCARSEFDLLRIETTIAPRKEDDLPRTTLQDGGRRHEQLAADRGAQ